MNKQKSIAVFLFFALCYTSSNLLANPINKLALKDTIKISGTRFLFPLIEKWATEFQKANPNIVVEVKFGIQSKDIDASAAPVKTKKTDINYIDVARYALVPITNKKNPALLHLKRKGLTANDIERIYFNSDNKQTSFSLNSNQFVPIKVYSRGACASATFTNSFGKEIKDLNNLDKNIEDDKALLKKIVDDTLGIAYNNLGFVYNLESRLPKNELAIIPIDVNNNGTIDVAENIYENLDNLLVTIEKKNLNLPPVGNVTFIFKENKQSIQKFITWIKAEGQKFNHSLGFLKLN